MYELLIFAILMLIISFNVFKKDIFSPSVIFFLGYIVSILFGIWNQKYWSIEISGLTKTIIILGFIFFFLGEFVSRYLFAKQNFNKNDADVLKIKRIDANKIFLFLFIILNIVITYIVYKEIKNIAAIENDTTDNIINAFKSSDYGLSGLATQLIKITKGSAYVYGFIAMNNLLFSIKNKKRNLFDLCYLIPGIIYCFQCNLRGGRYTVIAFILGLLFIIYFLFQQSSGWIFKLKIRHYILIIIGTFVVIYAFWAVKSFVGRSDDSDFVDYIARYLGGSIKLLDLYLQNPPSDSMNTFADLYKSLEKIGFSGLQYTTYHEFRFSETGVLIGNVYTSFRNYYNDFGMLGVVILSFLKSVVLSTIYCYLRSKKTYKSSFLIIFYMSLIYTIFFDFFVDYFYARLSIGYIIEVIIMCCIYYLIIHSNNKKIYLYRSVLE